MLFDTNLIHHSPVLEMTIHLLMNDGKAGTLVKSLPDPVVLATSSRVSQTADVILVLSRGVYQANNLLVKGLVCINDTTTPT